MSDILIWLLLIFVFLIIIGLYNSEFTDLKLSEKQKILDLNYITENFTPDIAPVSDQLEGSSELYHWGLPEDKVYNNPRPNKNIPNEEQCHHECQPTICPEQCPNKCPETKPTISSAKCNPSPSQSIKSKEICYNCDITLNKNIDKYVLKSSVPACPDMSDYVTKNMIPSNINTNLNDYILKSEVKACEKVDISKYILKSEIPSCPTCPECPICPICPVCPEPTRCKEIHQYDISDHPDYSQYIKKSDILNSPEVQSLIAKKDAIHKAILEEESITPGKLITNPKIQEYVKNQCTKYCDSIQSSHTPSSYTSSHTSSDSPSSYTSSHTSSDSPSSYTSSHTSSHTPSPHRIIEEEKIRHIVEEEAKKNDKPLYPMNLDVNGYYTGDSLFASVKENNNNNLNSYYAGDSLYGGI